MRRRDLLVSRRREHWKLAPTITLRERCRQGDPEEGIRVERTFKRSNLAIN